MRVTFKVLDSLSTAPRHAVNQAPPGPARMPPASRGPPPLGDPDRMAPSISRQSRLYSAGRRSRLRRDPRRPTRRSPPQRRRTPIQLWRRTPIQPTRARRVLSSFPRERARSLRVRSAWRRQSKLYSAGRRSRLRRDPRRPPRRSSPQRRRAPTQPTRARRVCAIPRFGE